MKNSIIPESELKILGEIFEKIDELFENHKKTPLTFEMLEKASDLEHIHIMVYMDFVEDFLREASALKSLLETSEDEFYKNITKDDKLSLEEVKRQAIHHCILSILKG